MATSKPPAKKTPGRPGGKDPRPALFTGGAHPPRSSLLDLQRSAGNEATGRVIGGMLVQAKLRTAGDVESPAAGEPVSDAMPGDSAAPESTPASERGPSEARAAPALIVDDSADTPGPGQMKKSDFFARLRAEAGAAIETALAGSEHAGHGQTAIDLWLGRYEQQDVDRINRDLSRFAGDGPRPKTAEEYVRLIAERVRIAAAAWIRTGELPDVPEGLTLPGMDLPASGGLPGALGTIGRVFFKAEAGGPRDAGDPGEIQRELGEGRPLDAAARSRMESALGRSFSNVRVHTDGSAAAAASRLNAKAFTVGPHVAFGTREYRPGTLAGDALLAHELAHVAQQGDARVLDSQAGGGAALEHDADRSAIGAVAALWGKSQRVSLPAPQSSGLRLQRCAGCGGTPAAAAPAQRRVLGAATDCSVPSPEDWNTEVTAAGRLQGDQRRDSLASLVHRALCGSGRRVAVAGNSHTAKVHPDDYEKLPVVNFDVHLNDKTAWTDDRPLAKNAAYWFHRGSDVYLVMGPNSVDERSPAFTKMYFEHELFHTEHDVGSRVPFAERELVAWTLDFRRYFHQLRGQQWSPLITYYEDSGADARARSLQQIVDYYNNPPVPDAEKESVRSAFRSWLQRRLGSADHRDKRLVQDLEAQLHVGTGQR